MLLGESAYFCVICFPVDFFSVCLRLLRSAQTLVYHVLSLSAVVHR